MLFPAHMPRRLLAGKRQLGLLQMLIMAAALFSALALVWLAHGMKATQHTIQLPYNAAAGGAGFPGQQRTVPRSLEFPLWWHAPFVAQSGELCKWRQLLQQCRYVFLSIAAWCVLKFVQQLHLCT
jgi:hypothetical protein